MYSFVREFQRREIDNYDLPMTSIFPGIKRIERASSQGRSGGQSISFGKCFETTTQVGLQL